MSAFRGALGSVVEWVELCGVEGFAGPVGDGPVGWWCVRVECVPRNGDDDGSGVDGGAVGSDRLPFVVGAAELVAGVVEDAVVVSAEQDEVGEGGGAAVCAVDDVVGVEVVSGGAAWPLAAVVVALVELSAESG